MLEEGIATRQSSKHELSMSDPALSSFQTADTVLGVKLEVHLHSIVVVTCQLKFYVSCFARLVDSVNHILLCLLHRSLASAERNK